MEFFSGDNYKADRDEGSTRDDISEWENARKTGHEEACIHQDLKGNSIDSFT